MIVGPMLAFVILLFMIANKFWSFLSYIVD